MRRASPPGPAPGETMRDPLTPPSDYVDHAAARRIVVGVLLTMLLAALDQVMVATALPTIAASLGDVDNMSWVVTANLLCATAATPLYGKLSDIHGRRAMMLIAIGVYAAGSLACALAPSMLTLILGRALQGLGGGGLMPLVQTIIGDGASPRDRPRYQAYPSSTFIVSTDPRRLHCRASPLVLDFLVQSAALRPGLSAHPQRIAAPAAPRPSARARPAGRRADGGRHGRAAARIDVGRSALWVGLAADPCPLRRLSNALDLVCMARDDCERAVHSAVGAARRRHARRHGSRLLRRRRGHCADHRAAALWPACAWALGERIGLDDHCAARRRHAHVDCRRPAARALRPL